MVLLLASDVIERVFGYGFVEPLLSGSYGLVAPE